MAEGTYEFECMRAELLGIAKPDEEEFEKARSERLQKEQEEQLAAEAEVFEQQDETVKDTSSKLDELGSILTSTQQKINRFKQSAAGSLSNIFGRSGSVDIATNDGSGSNVSSAGTSRRNTTANTANVNEALKNMDQMEQQHQEGQPVIPTEKIRQAKLDINKKMTSHLGQLDSMLNKAENAEISMAEQTQQMRKLAK